MSALGVDDGGAAVVVVVVVVGDGNGGNGSDGEGVADDGDGDGGVVVDWLLPHDNTLRLSPLYIYTGRRLQWRLLISNKV
ncbi:hypothetical protein F0562_022177 [Nyssa sinensis]|uniref:Uncharacterized protein n=1 Tax=Nyssa sinensis TaxID=561372 RepID=A0A5J5BQX9_9ASTE|nr:hypothetical protein F0562_022177 [Nyssa sinensis]